MATVKLYFDPYPEADADGLVIQESADGVSGWTQIELVTAIGTYPNWISSFTTANATSTDYWFRIAWRVGGVVQEFSDPIQVGSLAPKYTTPDLVKETTRHASLQTLATLYVQEMITQAYYMIQAECGPFDETNPGFIEAAPLAMRLYVEFLNVVQDPSALSSLTGTIEETIGSYRYRKSENAVELIKAAQEGVPANVRALLCRYSLGSSENTELITTDVFSQTPYYDSDSDLDKKYVVTSKDPDRTALDSDTYEGFKKFPSV